MSSPEGAAAWAATPAAVAVLGAGYVGLTTAACLAHLGHRVTAVDTDRARVDRLRRAEPTVLEEGLGGLLEEGTAAGRLAFTTDAAGAAAAADFAFLCVPTPQGADGRADLGHVLDAARGIGPHLRRGAVVVTKSTVPVGAAGAVVAAVAREDVCVVSNPEFLREGRAVHDWLHPDRVVIGTVDRTAGERVADLYRPLGAPVLVTDPASAETVKYASNAFLAAKVSFANAVAALCEAVGADVADVLAGMSLDPRIGSGHLAPGPGWGGSCLPKDTSALLRIAADHGYDFSLLREVVAANEAQFERVADQVGVAGGREPGGRLDGLRVAAWGLTFKSGTDDLRDSPALAVLARVGGRGATAVAFDPSRPDPADPNLAGIALELAPTALAACEGAECLAVLTEWPEFARVDLSAVAAVMARPAVVDARNLLDPVAARAAGLTYRGVGRP